MPRTKRPPKAKAPRKQKAAKRARNPRRPRPARPGGGAPPPPPVAAPNPPTVPPGFGPPIPAPQPQFGEPTPSADPTRFLDQKSDSGYFRLLNKTLLQRVPPPRDPSFTPDKLVLTLAQALGDAGPAKVKAIQAAGRIVFHSVGDTGPTKGSGVEVTDRRGDRGPAKPRAHNHAALGVPSGGRAEAWRRQMRPPHSDQSESPRREPGCSERPFCGCRPSQAGRPASSKQGAQGRSLRDIAVQLGCSSGLVHKTLAKSLN